jgi:hypothetical protein
MRIKDTKDDVQEPRKKEPIEMTSDELLDYALAPELADKVKRTAKDDSESADSERDC